MPKRSRIDADSPSKKRTKYETPTATVLRYADELVDCLQALKSGGEQLADLKNLCKTLLPAFAELAAEAKEQGDIRSEAEDRDEPDIDYGDNQSISTGPASVEGIRAPTFAMLTPWKPSEIATAFPPLPPIPNPALERAAFTHQGMCQPGDTSYEMLEWIGDAYLYLISSSFIYQTFPSLGPGRSSQLREQLVKNATLSGYANHYGFMDRAKLPRDIRSVNNKDRSKILGDIVEAYTGAVILSDRTHGLERAVEWLKAMWSMTLQDRLKKEFRDQNIRVPQVAPRSIMGTSVSKSPAGPAITQTRTPKEDLANLIRVPGVTIRYKDMECKAKDSGTGLPLFTVGVFVDGWGITNERLGFGTALGKKEAGQKAAKQAMENKAAMKQWIEWKQQYVAMNPPKPNPDGKGR